MHWPVISGRAALQLVIVRKRLAWTISRCMRAHVHSDASTVTAFDA